MLSLRMSGRLPLHPHMSLCWAQGQFYLLPLLDLSATSQRLKTVVIETLCGCIESMMTFVRYLPQTWLHIFCNYIQSDMWN